MNKSRKEEMAELVRPLAKMMKTVIETPVKVGYDKDQFLQFMDKLWDATNE